MTTGVDMWRVVVGSVCGVVGLATITASAISPASAAGTEARVQVAEYVRVADGGDVSSPVVDSNVAVSVSVTASGYDVTPR